MKEIIEKYYESFNKNDMKTFFSLLATNISHDINQGKREVGIQAFKSFMESMHDHYEEKVINLVIMCSSDNTHAAAEFIIEGKYLKTQPKLPEAKGQTYRIPVGAFFEIKNEKIQRVTNYYNLQEWIQQVSKP